jgi:hypothetical protein
MENPMMGEAEYVYELKVDSSGKITGSQRMPFGDSPIIFGKISGNEFELKVQTESFGNLQVATVKGSIEGETLKITPLDAWSRLKVGICSSPGPRTCGGFEGSYGHEEQDARTYAAWGIDYLKYDWCSA